MKTAPTITRHQQTFSGLLSPFVLILGVLALLLASNALLEDVNIPNKMQDFITLSLSIFVEALPFLVLGSILASIVNTYVSPRLFQKILPKNSVLKRASMSVLGFLFPVCECGNVPVSRAMILQGLKPSEAFTFLLSAPVVNPVTIWSTWAAFSYDSSIVVSRIAATLLIANLIGAVLSMKDNEQDFLTSSFTALCKAPRHNNVAKAKDKFYAFAATFKQEAFVMLKLLAFGALIAGAVQSFVPRDVLTGIGSNVILSIVAMLLLAFVVSICANVDAFFALSFANTFTAGSIVSFLVFGPMIDIKMLVLLKTTFKNNVLVVVSVLALLLSALAGLVVSYAF